MRNKVPNKFIGSDKSHSKSSGCVTARGYNLWVPQAQTKLLQLEGEIGWVDRYLVRPSSGCNNEEEGDNWIGRSQNFNESADNMSNGRTSWGTLTDRHSSLRPPLSSSLLAPAIIFQRDDSIAFYTVPLIHNNMFIVSVPLRLRQRNASESSGRWNVQIKKPSHRCSGLFGFHLLLAAHSKGTIIRC